MTPVEITDVLAALVCGGDVARESWRGLDVDIFCRAAERHGVLPLVAARLAGLEDVASPLRARMHELAHRQVAADLMREVELRRVLAELDRADIRALLMKGAQLFEAGGRPF